jgi:hypothetical protein
MAQMTPQLAQHPPQMAQMTSQLVVEKREEAVVVINPFK